MKHTKHLFVFFLMIAPSHAYGQENMSVGGGLGAMYSGIGVNGGVVSRHTYKYVSAGCTSIGYSSNRGAMSACGAGIGFINTNLIGLDNKKALGVYIGIVDDEPSSDNDPEPVYGTAISYIYYYKGINSNYWHLGASITAGDYDDGIEPGVGVEVGYQFTIQ